MGSASLFAWAFLHSAGILCVSCAADKRGFPATAQRGSSVYSALQVAPSAHGRPLQALPWPGGRHSELLANLRGDGVKLCLCRARFLRAGTRVLLWYEFLFNFRATLFMGGDSRVIQRAD